jgi:hypothetical protein
MGSSRDSIRRKPSGCSFMQLPILHDEEEEKSGTIKKKRNQIVLYIPREGYYENQS